jgi:D-alanine-D-alanine ligase-like ATP-grasp enzyme
MTDLGYLGADIVLDKTEGPMMLELNARPGLAIQIANSQGILERLEVVDEVVHEHQNLDERIRFAMEHFGDKNV